MGEIALKRIHIFKIANIGLFALMIVLLLSAWLGSQQSTMAMNLPLLLEGEYRLGDGEWRPYDEMTILDSTEGDFVFLGHLNNSGNEDILVGFYLNHINATVLVNGEEVYWSYPSFLPFNEKYCGAYWSFWNGIAISSNDEIEIRLHNPHKFGNENAYNEFMQSLIVGQSEIIEKELNNANLFPRMLSISIIIISLVIIGVALAALFLSIPYANFVWTGGWLALFSSVFILFDLSDISFISNPILVNSYVRQISIIMASYMLDVAIVNLMGTEKKKMQYIVNASCLFNLSCMLISLFTSVAFFDTLFYWYISQWIIVLLLLYCQGMENSYKFQIDGSMHDTSCY